MNWQSFTAKIVENAEVVHLQVYGASGFSLDGPAKKIIQVGAKDLMSKPYKAKQMLQLARRVLDSD